MHVIRQLAYSFFRYLSRSHEEVGRGMVVIKLIDPFDEPLLLLYDKSTASINFIPEGSMTRSRSDSATIYQRPVELLQNLVRFDTTNPPGNEAACISYINGLLKDAGLKTTLLGKSRQRTNVITRLKGRGAAAPLLLYAHVDVVTTEGQKWQQPPFAANIVDEYIWGRGTLDCKGPVAMMLAAVLKAKMDNIPLPGDVIFCAVADEEAGGNFGSRFLVDEHPDLFKDVKYAFGEFGGFNMNMGGKRIYPIMVAEKQCCWMKITFKGRGGHGSMPVHHQAVAKLARFLDLLDTKNLPSPSDSRCRSDADQYRCGCWRFERIGCSCAYFPPSGKFGFAIDGWAWRNLRSTPA